MLWNYSMVVCSFATRAMEKRLGRYAKYAYISILPVLGAATMVVGTPGAFGAMQMAYFLVLVLSIPYYDLSVVKVCTVVTVLVNGLAMILFSKSYLAMHKVAIWIFILMVYALGVVVAVLIVQRARSLFYEIEEKEKEVEQVLESVQSVSGNLYAAGSRLSDEGDDGVTACFGSGSDNDGRCA